jgi:glucan phosphoethanolaminetransferase (alkaline phosphatase superfamily)
MKVNWIIGNQDWAYKNFSEHIIKTMNYNINVINERDNQSDVELLVDCKQLLKNKNNSKTILHIDGNRWYDDL